jgi:hypothetical protein
MSTPQRSPGSRDGWSILHQIDLPRRFLLLDAQIHLYYTNICGIEKSMRGDVYKLWTVAGAVGLFIYNS